MKKSAVGFGLAYAQANGILTGSADASPFIKYFDTGVVFVAVAIMLAILINGLNSALARASSSEQAMREQNEVLQALLFFTG